ncbi:septum formation inhibitor Maf [bacterium]|nr:septum formation inhibitor Maf [bacterium]
MISSHRPSRLVLASASPRRSAMLGDLGLRFEIHPAHIDESLLPDEAPEAHAERLARAKAVTIAKEHPDALVLGVDTIVLIDGRVLGKPKDVPDAEAMLATIAGRTHTVCTAYAITAVDAGIEHVRLVKSRVTLRELSPERIAKYVATGEPMDKAGSYAIQGLGAAFVRAVEGSYTCVVGLPLCEFCEDVESLLGEDWLASITDAGGLRP